MLGVAHDTDAVVIVESMRMSVTTDVAIKTTCVADAAILAMVAILDMEDAGRAAGITWTIASDVCARRPRLRLNHLHCICPVYSFNAP